MCMTPTPFSISDIKGSSVLLEGLLEYQYEMRELSMLKLVLYVRVLSHN
jgi:hypothetical protein